MSEKIAEVTIMSDHAEVKTPTATKILTIPALLELVSCLNPAEETASSSGDVTPIILPRNTILYGRSPATVKIMTYHPGHMANLEHTSRSSKPFHVPMPNVIIQYTLRVESTRLVVEHVRHYATDKPAAMIAGSGFVRHDPHNHIWYLPMPNFFSGGDPCYGSNVMPRETPLENLSGLNWYYDYLEATPNNNDLRIPEVDTDQCSNYASEYLAFLEDGEFTSYPYEILNT